MSHSLLHEIETAAKALGIAPTTLCFRAVDSGNLPNRLKQGGTVTLVTAERLRAWIAKQTAGKDAA